MVGAKDARDYFMSDAERAGQVSVTFSVDESPELEVVEGGATEGESPTARPTP